jgi:ABC-type transporter Mla maintaining outer membrane lipid asymmetry ATPase subunit MlaF
MTAVLEVRGVTKAYGERAVLRGVDLDVEEHDECALVRAGIGLTVQARSPSVSAPPGSTDGWRGSQKEARDGASTRRSR